MWHVCLFGSSHRKHHHCIAFIVSWKTFIIKERAGAYLSCHINELKNHILSRFLNTNLYTHTTQNTTQRTKTQRRWYDFIKGGQRAPKTTELSLLHFLIIWSYHLLKHGQSSLSVFLRVVRQNATKNPISLPSPSGKS